MILLYKSSLKQVARELRTNTTKSEQLVWSAIRRKKLERVQFYRQKTIGPYIVDFYCPAAKLIIEIDGAHHLKKENIEQDRFRDLYLQQLGLKILRFGNNQVKNALPKVIRKILISIQEYRCAHEK